MGAPAPTPQHSFHPNRRWLLDFAWPDLRIAVEVHGGTFSRGRHVTGKGFWSDRIKMNAALRLNWKVFELVATDLGDARVYQEIIWELDQRAREGVVTRIGIPFNQVHPESKSRRQIRAERVLKCAARKAISAAA